MCDKLKIYILGGLKTGEGWYMASACGRNGAHGCPAGTRQGLSGSSSRGLDIIGEPALKSTRVSPQPDEN